MQLACPKCGTRDIRVSHRKGLAEHLRGVIGKYPLRCRRCNARWETSVWESGDWKYARCPRCYRQELTTWSEQYYNPPRWTRALLRMGATPYRCAACRCNFASFRRCKERFAWRHQEHTPAAGGPSTETGKNRT
jgi:Zn finger protein HypA/HybF involved in hydrogenase expression